MPGVAVIFGPVEGVHVEAALCNRSALGVRKVFTVTKMKLEVALCTDAWSGRGWFLAGSSVWYSQVVCWCRL